MKTIILILFSLIIIACGNKNDKISEENKSKQAAVTKVSPEVLIRQARMEELGREFKCPVMKARSKVREDTEAAQYNGKVYYFCCPGCSTSFKENPAKFTRDE